MPELTFKSLQLFVAFVVPGFVALKTYDLLVPSESRDPGAAILEAITFSMLNLGLWFWLVAWLVASRALTEHPVRFAIATLLILVLSPATLAILVFHIRMSRFATRWIQHPFRSAWDYFFSKRRACWMLFHMKNGERFGGYFGVRSFASSYPVPQEVYVEDVWRVNTQRQFVERVEGNFGMVLRMEDCQFMEFFEAED